MQLTPTVSKSSLKDDSNAHETQIHTYILELHFLWNSQFLSIIYKVKKGTAVH